MAGLGQVSNRDHEVPRLGRLGATLTKRSLGAQVGGRCPGHLAEAHHSQSLLPASAPSQPKKDGEAFCQWEKL